MKKDGLRRAQEAIESVKVAAEAALQGLADAPLTVDVSGVRSVIGGVLNLIESERLAQESRNAE